jgi:AraC-like DNA-binding protein
MKENTDSDRTRLDVCEMDKEWGFYLTDCGSQGTKAKATDGDVNPGSGIHLLLEDYQLRLIVSGEGTFQSAHMPARTYGAGNLFLLHPGEWYRFKPSSDTEQEVYWVDFNGRHVEEIINSGCFDKTNAHFRIGINDEYLAFFKSILRYVEGGEAGFQQVTSGIVRHMLGLMYFRHRNVHTVEDDIREKIDLARILISESITEAKSPVQIAEQLGLGYSWFRKAFKRHVGTSPAQYQIQLRLQRAKDLLLNTNLTVSEIAYELTFDTPCQFSTFFKVRANSTPLEYRRKCREDWSSREWGTDTGKKVLAHKELLPVQLYG